MPPADREKPAPGYEIRVLRAFRRIIRAVDLHSRRLLAEHDVTAPQLVCLLTIVESGPMTATDLAKQVFLSPSTIVGILDRLQEKGLVGRERQMRDRRLVMVSPTEAGKKVACRAPSPLQDTLADALGKLPELEQATIALSLERVVELMEAADLSAAPILDMGLIDPKDR